MMVQGRVVLHGPLHEVLESHRRLVVRFPLAKARLSALPGTLSIQGGPEEWTVISNGGQEAFRLALQEARGEVVEEGAATFEEIFYARASRQSAEEI
jgi:hypothetical protein